MDMIAQGFIAALTVLWLLSYIGFRKVFGYAFAADVLITGGMIYMFAGSYAGMMTGVIAGLMISITLKVGARVFGKERLALARRKGRITPSLFWRKS